MCNTSGWQAASKQRSLTEFPATMEMYKEKSESKAK
jgi:hypothetical protein